MRQTCVRGRLQGWVKLLAIPWLLLVGADRLVGTDRIALNRIRSGRDIGATQPEDDQDDQMAQSTSLGT